MTEVEYKDGRRRSRRTATPCRNFISNVEIRMSPILWKGNLYQDRQKYRRHRFSTTPTGRKSLRHFENYLTYIAITTRPSSSSLVSRSPTANGEQKKSGIDLFTYLLSSSPLAFPRRPL